MLLQIDERRIEPDIAVVELTGRFALGRESQRVESIVDELLKEGCTRAILDLTGVTYCDSAGIGLIALASGRLKEAGGRLVVVAPDGKVLDMLKMTQIDHIVVVCSTAKEAVGTFQSDPPATA
jgi:anti-sigma B factor antagonist